MAESLTRIVGHDVPLLGQIPLDMKLREGADKGAPVVSSAADSPSGVALRGIARSLGSRSRGLSGRKLGLTPTSR